MVDPNQTDPDEPDQQPDQQEPGAPEAEQETAWQRRKRLAAVFGDVLPDATRDERGPDSGKGDDWYRDQVPPHHG